MKTRSRLTVVLISIALAVPALAAAAGYPQARHGWLIGFGVGGGIAWSSGSGLTSPGEGGFGGTFRAGYAFQPQISLELDATGWSKEDDFSTTSMNVSTAALNWYPGGQGLVLRAGAGVGSSRVSTSIPPLAAAGLSGTTFSTTQNGFGLMVGAGYEFRVKRTFALGPQVDWSWMTLSDIDVKYVNGSIGLTWYFLPRP